MRAPLYLFLLISLAERANRCGWPVSGALGGGAQKRMRAGRADIIRSARWIMPSTSGRADESSALDLPARSVAEADAHLAASSPRGAFSVEERAGKKANKEGRRKAVEWSEMTNKWLSIRLLGATKDWRWLEDVATAAIVRRRSGYLREITRRRKSLCSLLPIHFLLSLQLSPLPVLYLPSSLPTG